MALPIGGRIRQQLSWAMLNGLARSIGIPDRLAAAVISEQTAAASAWIQQLEELPFDGSRIRRFQRLANARIRHIQPSS